MIGDIPMRRFENQIYDRDIIREILDQILVVNVAANDGEYPYVVPLNFGYEMTEEKLLVYVHGAREGHKVDVWKKNPKVTLTFSMFTNHPQDKYRGETHDYRSIMANGIIREVVRHQSEGQHGKAVQAILRHNGRGSNQFSVPHYSYMSVFVIECDWKHVTAKSENPVKDAAAVAFPTLEEIRSSQEPKFDYVEAFHRKNRKAQTEELHVAAGRKLCFVWETETEDLDLDVAAILLNDEQKVLRRYDVAFYNQITDRHGAVRHLGDDLLHTKGQECLAVYPEHVPEFCKEIVFWLSIHEGETRGQSLEMLKRLRILVDIDKATAAESGGSKEESQICLELDRETIKDLWFGKEAAVAVRMKKQECGTWELTGPDGTTLDSWKITEIFAHHGLIRWKE